MLTSLKTRAVTLTVEPVKADGGLPKMLTLAAYAATLLPAICDLQRH